jgi:hypothetical protein
MIHRLPLGFGLAVLALTATATQGCSALDLVNQLTGSGALSIQSFTATPSEVVAGSNVTLNWDVSGADSVQIDQGVGSVTASGSKQVMPMVTTVYTLLAKANSNSSSATSSVQVVVTPAAH